MADEKITDARLIQIICLIAEEPQGPAEDELDSIVLLIADHWGLVELEEDADRARELRASIEADLDAEARLSSRRKSSVQEESK